VFSGADQTVRFVLVLFGTGSLVGVEHRAVVPTETAVADVLGVRAVISSEAETQAPRADVLLFAKPFSTGVVLFFEVRALDCEVVLETDVASAVGCHPMR
jgi:hypothetical protein